MPRAAIKLEQAALSIIAVILGYVVMVCGTWFVQDRLGGVSFTQSSTQTILLGAIFVPLTAVVGGFLTAAIAWARPIAHVAPMCVLVAAETTMLTLRGGDDDPLWFDLGAGLSLIAGSAIGALIWRMLRAYRVRAVSDAVLSASMIV